mmetsp:Transcript_128147/g.358755  ORF Transcript_128147/g.358755 Transcript_128147/m.358755 type:complete len:104 (+) Transcript_128147:74-385(+)
MKFANAPLLQLLALALLFVATPAASAESPALFAAAAAADEELKDNDHAPRSLLDNEVVPDAVDEEDAEQEKAGNLRSGAAGNRRELFRAPVWKPNYRLFKPTN